VTRICYSVTCPSESLPDQFVTDQFGQRTVAKLKAKLVCTPAVKGAEYCGDGVIGGDEECEVGDLGGATCEGVGFVEGGTLACAAGCRFDISGCAQIAACGNGTAYNSSTGECEIECGNGVFEGGEECEVDWASRVVVTGGGDCVSEGFDAGALGCAPGCVYDTSGCRNQTCGDGFADPPEECDGGDLNGETCVGLGSSGGVLACTGGCTLDSSGCTACSPGLQEDWDDGDAVGWNGWRGVQSISGGILQVTRTATSWGVGSRPLPTPLTGSIRVSLTMSLVDSDSQTDICLVNTSSVGLIDYMPSGGGSIQRNGYCLVLNNESSNGSPPGVELVPNLPHNNGGTNAITSASFVPAEDQVYQLVLTRTAAGEWEIFVDGVSAGTAVNTSTMTFDAVSLIAGADGSVGAGGSYDDILVQPCAP
jgi:hypothetical protein